MNFVWSEMRPRTAGWYWYRGPWARTGIYEVTEHDPGYLYVWFRRKKNVLAMSIEGQWVGPIEPPSER